MAAGQSTQEVAPKQQEVALIASTSERPFMHSTLYVGCLPRYFLHMICIETMNALMHMKLDTPCTITSAQNLCIMHASDILVMHSDVCSELSLLQR
jgi:hypothetical protein